MGADSCALALFFDWSWSNVYINEGEKMQIKLINYKNLDFA